MANILLRRRLRHIDISITPHFIFSCHTPFSSRFSILAIRHAIEIAARHRRHFLAAERHFHCHFIAFDIYYAISPFNSLLFSYCRHWDATPHTLLLSPYWYLPLLIFTLIFSMWDYFRWCCHHYFHATPWCHAIDAPLATPRRQPAHWHTPLPDYASRLPCISFRMLPFDFIILLRLPFLSSLRFHFADIRLFSLTIFFSFSLVIASFSAKMISFDSHATPDYAFTPLLSFMIFSSPYYQHWLAGQIDVFSFEPLRYWAPLFSYAITPLLLAAASLPPSWW